MSIARIGLLVGVDGSECGWQALDWAVAEAADQRIPVTVVDVQDGWPPPEVPVPPEVRAFGLRATQATVDTAVARVRRAAPDVPVDGRAVTGEAAACLLELSADAEQVVVGSRGLGGFAALVLGSVGAAVAAHAPCPVVVVRGTARPGGPVVVGVDGSARGDQALGYAFKHAAQHGLTVRAVHAYRNFHPSMGAYPNLPVDVEMLRESAEQLARDAVDRWSAKYPQVPLELVVECDTPARQLVEASEAGSMVVVGCRGHGGFAGLLLGSVSQAVVRHAHCPVAVVR